MSLSPTGATDTVRHRGLEKQRQGGLSALPDAVLKCALSFLPLSTICVIKRTQKHFRGMRIENLTFQFGYFWGSKDTEKFIHIMTCAAKNNCFFSTVIATNLNGGHESTYQNVDGFHDKNGWITALTQHPIKQLKIKDYCLELSGTGLQELTKIAKLENLDLRISRTTLRMVPEYLVNFTKLHSITLGEVDKNGIENLSKLECLFELNILSSFFGRSISNKEVEYLKNTKIKILHLKYIKNIDPDCFAYLSKMPQLEELHIRGCEKMGAFSSDSRRPEVAADELRIIATKIPHLKRFNHYNLSEYRASAQRVMPLTKPELPLDAEDVLLQPVNPPKISVNLPRLAPNQTPKVTILQPQPAATAPNAPTEQPKPVQQNQTPKVTILQPQPAATAPNAPTEQPKPVQQKQTPEVTVPEPQPATASPTAQPNLAQQTQILKVTVPEPQPATSPNATTQEMPVVDKGRQSWPAQLWSGIISCFTRLWSCICALFCWRASK